MSPLSRLAVPFVYALIFFLGYPSQWLLMHLEPGPLTKNELIWFNAVLVLIWITYSRSVFVDPGRIPRGWRGEKDGDEKERGGEGEGGMKSRKWCRKCDAAKPPRAHHCKECGRCIPKMDHHCPWTSNCVSHTTFPHFLRFLLTATLGLFTLQLLLFPRLSHLWRTRDLPSYLGPTLPQLTHLFLATATNTLTLFLLTILLLRNLYSLAINTTTIESWEISRHETLIRRARHFGGYLSTPDGGSIRIRHQEFPYDIGILSNIAAGMGSKNPLAWINPFASTPGVETGIKFEVNGFEDEDVAWPPPDPDRAYRRKVQEGEGGGEAFTYRDKGLGREETVAAFRARQAEDVKRRRPFVARMEGVRDREREGYGGGKYAGYGEEGGDYDAASASEDEESEGEAYEEGEGEEGWRNSEGERLKDFGVDEDVEFYDEQEDDIPLSVLRARRQAAAAESGGWVASGSTY